jgi:hypothetical protein
MSIRQSIRPKRATAIVKSLWACRIDARKLLPGSLEKGRIPFTARLRQSLVGFVDDMKVAHEGLSRVSP